MYFSDLGTIALILAFGFAVLAMVFGVIGGIRSNRSNTSNKEQNERHDGSLFVACAKRSTLVVTALLLIAAASLVVSFLTHDFGVRYVAEQSSLTMPWYFLYSPPSSS